MPAPKDNQYAKGNPGGGRPTEFDAELIPLVIKICELGGTDLDIADSLGVTERTIRIWKNTYEEFSSALKVAKEIADKNVERSLYRKAIGYEFESEKVFCSEGTVVRAPIREFIPPSDTAMIFWLKNRKSKEWRDKTEVEVIGELADRIAKARKRKE